MEREARPGELTFQPLALEPRRVRDIDPVRMAKWLRALGSPVRLEMLWYLTRPHYLEEIASHLKLTRQSARKHLDKLVAIGVLEKRGGMRDSGPVTEYLLNPQALFLLYDEFEKLGSLRSERRGPLLAPTMAEPGRRPLGGKDAGPCLYVVRGLHTGQRFPLSQGREVNIGRDPRCDFVVDHDPFVSNRHAGVRWDHGRFVLADFRSMNGTMHNWGLLPRGLEVPLAHGDLVGVGRTILAFWNVESARG